MKRSNLRLLIAGALVLFSFEALYFFSSSYSEEGGQSLGLWQNAFEGVKERVGFGSEEEEEDGVGQIWLVGSKDWMDLKGEDKEEWRLKNLEFFASPGSPTPANQSISSLLVVLSPHDLSHPTNAILPYLLPHIFTSVDLEKLTVITHPSIVSTIQGQLQWFFTSPLSSRTQGPPSFDGGLSGLSKLKFATYEAADTLAGNGVGVIDLGSDTQLGAVDWIVRVSNGPGGEPTLSKSDALEFRLKMDKDVLQLPNPFVSPTSLKSASRREQYIDRLFMRALASLPLYFDDAPSSSSLMDTRDIAAHVSQLVYLLDSLPKPTPGLSNFWSQPVSTSKVDAEELTRRVAEAAQSISPMGWISQDNRDSDEDEDEEEGKGRRAWWKWLHPTVSTSVAVIMSEPSLSYTIIESLSAHLQGTYLAQQIYLDSLMEKECEKVKVEVKEEDMVEAFQSLNGEVQLITLNPEDNWFYALACSNNGQWSTLKLERAMQYLGGIRSVKTLFRKAGDGVEMKMMCGERWMAHSIEQGWVPAREGEWFKVDDWDGADRTFVISKQRGQGNLRWVEGKDRSLGVSFGTGKEGNEGEVRWRLNGVCLASEGRGRWDLWSDDPLTISQVIAPPPTGRYNLTESTLAFQTCQSIQSSLNDLDQRLSEISVQGNIILQTASNMKERKDDDLYVNWAGRNLALGRRDTFCTVRCDAPIPCVSTQDCRCPPFTCNLSTLDEIKEEKETGVAILGSEKLSLTERVDNLPWSSVILPEALKTFMDSVPSFSNIPSVYVIPVHQNRTVDRHWELKQCFRIEEANLPSLGDHYLVQSIFNGQKQDQMEDVNLADADYILLPYYHGCYSNYLHNDNGDNLRDTIQFYSSYITSQGYNPEDSRWWNRLIIPFTHDFGECVGWSPTLEGSFGWRRGYPMEEAISWQPNGDLNTPCFKPGRDIVVPGTSKHVPELKSKARWVKETRDRRVISFFKGGVRGFGSLVRTRISCGVQDQDDVLYQRYIDEGESGYVDSLLESKFCLLPRGVQAWTTRTYEAMYAGCIPVFLADNNLPPFYDIFDWSTFSISISELQAHKYLSILRSLDPDRLARMQASLLKIREFFVFEGEHEMKREQSPVKATLLALKMKRGLKFPVKR